MLTQIQTQDASLRRANAEQEEAAAEMKRLHKLLVEASREAAKADGVAIAASAIEAVKGVSVIVTMLPVLIRLKNAIHAIATVIAASKKIARKKAMSETKSMVSCPRMNYGRSAG